MAEMVMTENAKATPAGAGRMRTTYFLLAATVIIWGIQPLCIKWLVEVWTPVTITAMRYYLIGTALILMASARGERWLPPKECLPALLAMAVTGIGLNNVMQFTGLQYSTVTNCTLIAAASPAITAFMAALFLRERLGALAWGGIFLSFAGAVAVVARGNLEVLARLDFNQGDVLFLLAQVAWTTYSLVGLRVMGRISAVLTTGWAGLLGALLVTAYGAVTGELQPVNLSTYLWLAFAYTVICGGVMAMLFWNIGVKKAGPSTTAIFQNITPLVGMLGGSLMFAEQVGTLEIIGTMGILGGVYITTHRAKG